MSFLKVVSQKNPKIATVLGSIICLGVVWERAHSFAQAQQKAAPPQQPDDKAEKTHSKAHNQLTQSEKIDLPLSQTPMSDDTPSESGKTIERAQKRNELLQKVPLEQRAAQRFDSVKTKQEACKLLEGKVLTYYDAAAFIFKCVQRPIEDAELLNELVYKQRKIVAEVPALIYRLIPVGEPWVGKYQRNITTSRVCRELNGRYVTSTGTDYFIIQNCEKRAFSSYVELQAHNKGNAPVLTVSPDQLEKLTEGKAIEGSYDREVEALYKIVGDSTLSPLGSADGRSKPIRSAADLAALPDSSINKSSQVDGKKLCREFNNKVISFYSQIYFITNCQKRLVKELPISIQQSFAEQGKYVIDVTNAQIEAIPTGKELSEDEIIEMIK